MRAALPGLLYFVAVYAAGFVLGTLRSIVLEPNIGTLAATLIEAPLIMAASYFAARYFVRRYLNGTDAAPRLQMGAVALGLLLIAEALMAGPVRGWSFGQWLDHFSTAEGLVSLVLFLIFASIPALLPRRLP